MLFQRLSTSLLRTPFKRSQSLTIRLAIHSQRRAISSLPRLPIFEALVTHDPKSTAVIHSASGRTFTYGELIHDVVSAKENLLERAQGRRLEGERIGFLIENSYDYVVTLLSILSTHSIALPLSPAFPAKELQYVIDNSRACMVISTPKFEGKAEELLGLDLQTQPTHVKLEKYLGGGNSSGEVILQGPSEGDGGMMLYTSGTTNRPKGVLLPTAALTAQSHSLIQAWEYTPKDHFLHVLPLHHIHGTINALLAPLFSGSTIEFLFPFNPLAVWTRFASPFLPTPTHQKQTATQKPITVFTAVPTIYTNLLNTISTVPPKIHSVALQAIQTTNLRLSISGSAALPTPTKQAWTTLSSGNILLERYGMTEVGMALSCGLSHSTRIDGSVGFPLPGVEVRLVDTETGAVIPEHSPGDGEIQLRGPTIFKEYWDNPSATANSFASPETGDETNGKWFKTGDIAERRISPPVPPMGSTPTTPDQLEIVQQEWAQGPRFHILGRLSTDIIKIGGEKVSALEIERELLSLPNISEAAVVGIPSRQLGQKIAAIVVMKADCPDWKPMDMRRALRGRLAKFKLPGVLRVVSGIERNAMGKINKKELVKKHFPVREVGGKEDHATGSS